MKSQSQATVIAWIAIAATGPAAGCRPAPPPAQEERAEPPPPAEKTLGAKAPSRGPGEDQAAPQPAEPAAPERPAEAAPTAPPDSPLLHPERAVKKAPERFSVVLETTKGDIQIDVRRSWAPLGADRFYNLVDIGYFTDLAFFRVVEDFMAQVGIHGSPEVNRAWRHARIKDDPVAKSNTRGMISFATSGPNSRVNQFFINFTDNSRLDGMGFAPFGLARNMEVVDKLYSGYGEGAPTGRGPVQALIQSQGNKYLRKEFPAMDYIRRAFFVDQKNPPPKTKSNIETPK